MMEKDKLNALKSSVENNLQQQIANLESVKRGLEEDLRLCPVAERDTNQKLFDTTAKLLSDLKLAQANITLLASKEIE